MARLTLALAKGQIARVLGTCDTDTRVRDYLNDAQQRLMFEGKWAGTVQRYRVCLNRACITWPRQIETLEAAAICDTPVIIRNSWYEYLGNGPGLIQWDDGLGRTMLDRTYDNAVTHSDPLSATLIRIHSDAAESATARILVQGYDENATWIRTQDAGTWVNGEYITIKPTGTVSTKQFSSITGIIKPVTNSWVHIHEYSASAGVGQELGVYEDDETHPRYRRTMLPGLEDMGACQDSAATCDNKYITILAKVRHIPVRNDDDWLVLTNLPALKLEVQAIMKEERNLFEESVVYHAKAISLLQAELDSHMGHGAVQPIRTEDPALWGAGAIEAI